MNTADCGSDLLTDKLVHSMQRKFAGRIVIEKNLCQTHRTDLFRER